MNIVEFLPDCHDQNILYFESSLMQMKVSIYSHLLEVDYYNKEICKKSHLTLSSFKTIMTSIRIKK